MGKGRLTRLLKACETCMLVSFSCKEWSINSWQTIGPEVPSSGNALTRWLGRCLLRGFGWTLQGEVPNRPQFIIAVAPHTSNFDFVLTVGVILSLGLRTSYLAKASLFRFPLGMVMRLFGGIPVDRGSANGMVDQMTAQFAASPKMILGIAPEGTRQKVRKWRSGFALIAQSANVPVQPAIVDYRTKIVTFSRLIVDVADADETLRIVQQEAMQARG
jgi:1-acyl-sn-glycerol-3-phosphate acyltransferase